MAYLSEKDLHYLGFKKLGKNVKISDKASIYNPNQIEIGDHSRIDDFCVISGNIKVGNYVHITPMCLVAGGIPGIEILDFSTLAYGVRVFAQSDDYSGETMCNSTIPKKFKKEFFSQTIIGRQVIVGAGATIMPGANIADGCAIGSMSLILSPTEPWSIYAGVPAKKLKSRSQHLLKLEAIFKKENNDDSL